MAIHDKTRSSRRKDLLGVAYSQATHRLRKLLLYNYVVKADEHKCYRCGLYIESIDEFSIDHKRPWENISAELFWDLSNIAFSHLSCNTKAGRKNCFPGQKWCPDCASFLPIELFRANAYRGDSRQAYCKKHQKERSRTSAKNTYVKHGNRERPNLSKLHRERRKVGPEGTNWCYMCQDYLSEEMFSKDSRRWNKLSIRCKSHDRELRNRRKP